MARWWRRRKRQGDKEGTCRRVNKKSIMLRANKSTRTQRGQDCCRDKQQVGLTDAIPAQNKVRRRVGGSVFLPPWVDGWRL